MKYGYYEKAEKNSEKKSGLSTYSEVKEKEQNKISQQERKISSQQNNTKGIAFGNIKKVGSEASKEASNGISKTAASTAASKAPSVTVQVIDKVKAGFEKALEHARPAEQQNEPGENSSGHTMGILSVCCFLLCMSIVFPVAFLPLLSAYSTFAFFTGGIKQTETKQVPHVWEPYERDRECENCMGTGLNLCKECSGTTTVPCNTCGGAGYTYMVINKSGRVFSNKKEYEYRSYIIESGCVDCGGSGKRAAYYEGIMGIGERLTEINYQKFQSGIGMIDCVSCNASGRIGMCLSCNGQGVYYRCIHADCPYHEWNNWESLGVDLDGICYEKEVEVKED
ncbi:MAG: hypothetical protein ACI4TK_06110 [Agathobacter sp.]